MLLAFTLFLRLLIYRIFAVSQDQPWTEVCRTANLADAVIILLLLTGAAIFLIKSVLSKEPFPRTAIDIPILVFLAASSISLFYSIDKQSTATAVVTLFANIAVFYTLIGLLRTAYRIKLFTMLLIGAGLMVSLFGLIHYFFIYKEMIIGGLPEHIKHAVNLKRISSLFGWPNLLAGFLHLIIPLSVMSIFVVKSRGEKFCMAIAAAIIFTAMFLTYSISSWVSLLLGSTGLCEE